MAAGRSRRRWHWPGLALLVVAATTLSAMGIMAVSRPSPTQPAIPLTGAQAAALADAAAACPTLTRARIAGQVMATTRFERSAAGGISGLSAAEWERWKPWNDAAPTDDRASLLALAHVTCDLMGHLRAGGFSGDLWPLAVAALASSLDDVRSHAAVPSSVAGVVEQARTYSVWYQSQLDPPRTPGPIPTRSDGLAATASPTAVTTPTPTATATPSHTGPTPGSGVSRTAASTTTSSSPPPTTTPPVTFSYAQFADASGLRLNGSARVGGGRLDLTTTTNQAGSAWATTNVDLSRSFTSAFTAVITEPTDGLAFVIQSQGTLALGIAGGGIGYGTGPNDGPEDRIRPSVAIEFDTWDNSPDGFDPPGHQHVAVTRDGNIVNHLVWADPNFDMCVDRPFYVWLRYDAAARRLAVYVSQRSTQPSDPLLTWTADLRSLVGNSAYVGFTGGTGGTNLTGSRESVLSWTFTSA